MTLDMAVAHLRRDEALNERGILDAAWWYLYWSPPRQRAVLDGDFTAQDLEAIAVVMQAPHEMVIQILQQTQALGIPP